MVNISDSANGFAIDVSDQFPGSVSDFEIFLRPCRFHIQALKKREGKQEIADFAICR